MIARRSSAPLFVAPLAVLVAASGCGIKWTTVQQDAEEREAARAKLCAKYPYSGGDCEKSANEDRAAQADWAEKQRAFDAAFAGEIAEFRAMQPSLASMDADGAKKAEDLRKRFLTRCIAESGWSTAACWDGTFARDITEALASFRLKQGDLGSAGAEALTLKSIDLRSVDAKVWKIHDLQCGPQAIFAGRLCEGDAKTAPLAPELDALFDPPTRDDEPAVDYKYGPELTSITRIGSNAVVTFLSQGGNLETVHSCDDPEWRTDANGNEALVRPCTTSQYVTKREVFPPATVPAAELGDFKLGGDAVASVVYALKGSKHTGHVMETWIDLHRVENRREVTKPILFRGLPSHEAKPGYP
jgi:hypothetical protein